MCASISSKRWCCGAQTRRRRWLFPQAHSPSPARAPADATAVITASISRGSGRPSHTAWRRSRSSVTHRPTTDSPSPTSRATDAIADPVPDTRHATSRRYSGIKRPRVPIPGTSLSAGTHTRFTKRQQQQPKPIATAAGKRVPAMHKMRRASPDWVRPSVLRVLWRCPTLPQPVGCSTIGAAGLSFQVRNGGWAFPRCCDHHKIVCSPVFPLCVGVG